MSNKKISFSDSFQEKLGKFATKINNNIFITALRDAMLAYMPFTFIGSIFLIIAFLSNGNLFQTLNRKLFQPKSDGII